MKTFEMVEYLLTKYFKSNVLTTQLANKKLLDIISILADVKIETDGNLENTTVSPRSKDQDYGYTLAVIDDTLLLDRLGKLGITDGSKEETTSQQG